MNLFYNGGFIIAAKAKSLIKNTVSWLDANGGARWMIRGDATRPTSILAAALVKRLCILNEINK